MLMILLDSIRDILKDAGSAEFKAVFTSFYNDSRVTCGEGNVTNSLGGYEGFNRFIATSSAGIRVVRGDGQMRGSEFEKVWDSAYQILCHFESIWTGSGLSTSIFGPNWPKVGPNLYALF